MIKKCSDVSFFCNVLRSLPVCIFGAANAQANPSITNQMQAAFLPLAGGGGVVVFVGLVAGPRVRYSPFRIGITRQHNTWVGTSWYLRANSPPPVFQQKPEPALGTPVLFPWRLTQPGFVTFSPSRCRPVGQLLSSQPPHPMSLGSI